MIIYADRAEKTRTKEALQELIGRIGQDDAVSLLIRYGQLEAAIADALQPEEDDWNHTIQELRFASILFAMYAGHKGCEVGYDFQRLLTLDLPEEIEVRQPEGFAYYAVFPEQYREAAIAFAEEVQPRRCGVIGIRSIGAALSAVVAEAVFNENCDVFTYTVRPHGHPFDRYVRLTPPAVQALRDAAPEYYLVVDEGPGISGSSFAAVCRMLEEEIGAPRERIVMFPSWEAPAEALRSESARSHWEAHRKLTASFEDTCLPKLQVDSLTDISGGAWRRYLYASEQDYPAVQPQHERRKYVALQGSTQMLYKFSGLGDFGRERFRRAQALSRAGFLPEVTDLRNGFIARVFEHGRPLSLEDLNDELIGRMAEYLAFVGQHFPASTTPDNLEYMVRINVTEGLGTDWADRIDFTRFRHAVSASSPVKIDGRMLPHEWITTARGYLKTDSVDHHNDHFYPGVQPIAWDLAGAMVEWHMTADQRGTFLNAFAEKAQGESLAAELPYFELAYLAYRLGYVAMAEESVAHDEAEADRFRTLKEAYSGALRKLIEAL